MEQAERDWHGPAKTLERDAELVAVEVALDHLCGGSQGGGSRPDAHRGGLLAFTGSAGAGKTTVLAEVRRLTSDRECVGLFASGGELEQGRAFYVVRQLLRPLLAAYPEREHREVLGAWYDIVGPCVGLCPVEGGAAPDPQGVRDGLDWAVINLAARYGPLVLVVDDAHWADPESLAWLASFASRVEELSVLVVVAYRPERLLTQAPAFHGVVARNRTRPLELAPLTPAAVAELVRDALGRDVPYDFCREAWLVTGGNPFETVELIAKIRDRDVNPWQESISLLRDMAAATSGSGLVNRLEGMGTSAVRLAWAVAVLGADNSDSLAMCVAGLGPAEAADAAERLRAERILAGTAKLEFVHPLIATAVYRAIPAAMRVALHGKAAWELVAAGQGAAAAARHLLETHPEGDPWVVERLREAARENLGTGAPDAAYRCLSRALREPPPAELQARVLFELGSPALLHDPATTVNHLRAALAEPDLDTELRTGIVIRLSRALAHCGRQTEAVSAAADEARAATDSRVRLRMHTEHFMRAAFLPDEQGAPARSRRLARLVERLTGDEQTERYLFGLRAWDAMVRGESAAIALKYAERALVPSMSWTDDHWGYEVPMLVTLTFMYCDRPDRAEELFEGGIAEFERQGWRGAPLSLGYSLIGYLRLRSGRLADAEDFARAGLRLATRLGAGGIVARWYAVGSLIKILLARGDVTAAQEMADRFAFGKPFPEVVTLPDVQTVHGELLLAQGKAEEAADNLAEAGRRLDLRGMHNPAWCPWLPQLALACRQTDAERARDLAQKALRRAERFGTASAMGQALLVAARLHDGTEAVDLLQRAVTQLEQSPSLYELACALVELGSLMRQAGRAQDAANHLYRGVEVAVQCGADAVLARGRKELSASGLRPRRLGIVR